MSRTSRTSLSGDALLTVAEVARRLRCSDDTVRRRVADGSLAAVRLGHLTRIPQVELERVLARSITPRVRS